MRRPLSLRMLWTRGFLQSALLPLAWMLPVHGLSFSFRHSRIDQLLWGHFDGKEPWDDLPSRSAFAIGVGAVCVFALALDLAVRVRARRQGESGPDLAGLGLLTGGAAGVFLSQFGPLWDALAEGRGLESTLLSVGLRVVSITALIGWCVHRAGRPPQSVPPTGSWWRSGFCEGALLVLLLLFGLWQFWFRFGWGPLETLLFQEPHSSWWWRMVHPGPRGVAARLVCALLAVPLLYRLHLLRCGRANGEGRQILSGMAAGACLYLGLSQLGPAMGTVRLGASDGILSVLRLGLAGGGATFLTVVSLRSVLGAEAVLRRVASGGVLLTGIVMASLGPVARAVLDHEAWRDARLDGSLGALARYVRTHPGTSRLPEIRRLAWKRVREAKSVGPVQDYLIHARAWGDRMDSARRLEADWFRRVRARSLRSSFSQDSLVDRFWRERLPDSLGPYRGSRIVRYHLVLDSAGFAAQARVLGRKLGKIVSVPSEGFDPWGEDFPARLASVLDSAVHPWAGPSLLTIAPRRDASRSPDFEIRVQPRAVAPLEPVPCSPGCPLDSAQRQALPALAYRLETIFHLNDGRTHRLVTELLDTNFGYSLPPEEEANGSRAGAWENLDLPGAWARRRENSLQGLDGAFRDIWREHVAGSGR